MLLLELTIAGSVAYAGIRTYQHNRKKPLGQLLATETASIRSTEALTPTATPAYVQVTDMLETWHQTHIAPQWTRITNLIHTLRPSLPLLFQDTHSQHLTALTGQELASSTQEENYTRNLAIALVSLGVASVTTLAHSPLIIACFPLLGYIYVPILKNCYQAFRDKRYRLLRLFETIIVGWELFGGYYLASSLASTFYFTSERALLKAEGRSLHNIVNVFGTQPRTAWALINGTEVEIDCNQLQPGDSVIVHAGDIIPVDGSIVQGIASIDQHMLTGESQPVDKGVGDSVMASTIVLSGKIAIQVERAGSDTTAAQIGDILNTTAAYKERIAARSIAFVERFIIPTLALGFVSYPFVGSNRALALLESAFGYNLRISGPMSMLNLLQIAAQQGILIKDGLAMDTLRQIDTVVFDKTGTLTLEQPHVGTVHAYHGLHEDVVLAYAATAEYRQTHPIARAILEAARQHGIDLPTNIDTAEYRIGYGIKVSLNGQTIGVGSERFMDMEGIALPPDIAQIQEACHEQGASLVCVAVDGILVGAIELHPTIRPEAQTIIRHLKQRNLTLYILSGDHEQPTRYLAQRLGIDAYIAEVLPQHKADYVQQLQQEGRMVCFVGDGINDSIALQQANISISMRGASTAATDTAQIVLMDGSLRHLINLLELDDTYQKNMRGNLAMATIPSVICIGGVYFLHWGLMTAIILYNISVIASLGNAFVPLIVHHLTRKDGGAVPVHM